MPEGGVILGISPFEDILAVFLLQIILIVVLCRIIDFIFKLLRLRQPRVIAEVVAGILLGPSAFGRIPGFTNAIFPTNSLPILQQVSQLGLVFYLFLVGLELDLGSLRARLRQTAAISLSGMIVPFASGIAVSFALYNQYGDKTVPFASFMVFLGVAMSITAFPVLARVLTELDLLPTVVGQTTISAAAVDDACAWVLLALVISLVHAQTGIASLYVFLSVVGFGLFLIFAVRPALLYVIKRFNKEDGISEGIAALIFLLVVSSAWITQVLGVHAIFGGFLVGAIIPHQGGVAVHISKKVEDFVTIIFLPLYFAFSGLRTRIDLLSDGLVWGYVFLVIAVACGGKIIGAAGASKLAGHTWRDSFAIGFLMNCKGLVELIVLNVGKDAGVINTTVFTIMVVMALVTTFMTTPIVSFIYPPKYYYYPRENKSESSLLTETPKGNHVLICLTSMKSVPGMMALTHALKTNNRLLKIHALRLLEDSDLASSYLMQADSTETMNLDPVINVFRTFGKVSDLNVSTLVSVAKPESFGESVITSAADVDADFVIVPWGENKLFVDALATGPCSFGLFIDRGFGINSVDIATRRTQSVFLPFFGGQDDREAVTFVLWLASHSGIHVHVVRYVVEKSASLSSNQVSVVGESTRIDLEEGTGKKNDNDADAKAISLLPAIAGSEKNEQTSVVFENVTVENPKQDALERAKQLNKKDLIVIGWDAYSAVESDEIVVTGAVSLKSFVENEAIASALIVRKQGTKELVA